MGQQGLVSLWQRSGGAGAGSMEWSDERGDLVTLRYAMCNVCMLSMMEVVFDSFKLAVKRMCLGAEVGAGAVTMERSK